MRTYEEIMASARDEPPFSNGTEGYGWMENWCWAPCQQPAEVAWQRYEDGKRKTDPGGGCPLILCALLGKTPSEWLEQDEGPDRFHCIEFRAPGGGGGGDPQPRPRRDPPNMEGLFPRPERRVRMLIQPEPLKVLADV